MRRAILMGLIAAAAAAPLVAQQSAEAESRSALLAKLVDAEVTAKLVEQVGNARIAVETRTTKGAPYAADAVTEFVQVLSDGNRIVRRTTTRLVRDSEGRTRRETISANGAVESVVITDPVGGNN